MSRRDDAQRLRDMRDAAQAAIRVLGDHSADELENTEALALAVPHAVEIVGEAASRVSRPFCEAHPEIAWSEVTGMRHASFTTTSLSTTSASGTRSMATCRR
jgi:uncharacterized protein with HEPN domain